MFNKRISSRQLLIRLLLLSIVITLAVCSILTKSEYDTAIRKWREHAISDSSANAASYYTTLVSKIVANDTDGLNELLSHIKNEERLKGIQITPAAEISKSVLSTCGAEGGGKYFTKVPTCFEFSGSSLFVYHKLQSVGYSVGYLIKTIPVPTISTLLSNVALLNSLAILCCCVGIAIISFSFMRRYFVRPIHAMILSIQNDHSIDENIFGVAELRNLAGTLKKSFKEIADYQSRIKSIEFDAKLGKLSSRIAHDIRSPLSSMRSALMLLREKFGGNKGAEDMFNLLQLSSNRLDNIANGLLAKYMGESSVEQLFSIHEVLDELIGELRASPLGQGTEFEKQYYKSALYVIGDRTGVSRAIGNIIKNALEAMQKNLPGKPKQLTVCTDFCQPQVGNVCIRIADTGPGIPAEKIPLILQGGHTEGKVDGHGIGTKVVKEMVEAHKGQLSIESQVGEGTSFVISLPATIQNDETVVTIPQTANAAICVIDDEPSLREQWRLTLKAQGVDALMFSCWEEFASCHQTDSSPLAQNDTTFIVDYHFDNSEVDGLEVIRRLKAQGFDKFILATAEYWKPAVKDAAKELNVTLCPKPLPKVVLVELPTCHPELQAKDIDSSVATIPQNEKQGPSVLLIDDDPDIQTSWKLMKSMLGVGRLTMYSKLEDMIAAATNPADYDLCIIDKNIEGSQYSGAKMLAHLKENGAHKVFLASGEDRRQIEEDPQFASIDGILTEKVPMSLEGYLN